MISAAALERRKYRRKLLERLNRDLSGTVLKNVTTKSMNRAVCIARRPGPMFSFRAGNLDKLLGLAGFRGTFTDYRKFADG